MRRSLSRDGFCVIVFILKGEPSALAANPADLRQALISYNWPCDDVPHQDDTWTSILFNPDGTMITLLGSKRIGKSHVRIWTITDPKTVTMSATDKTKILLAKILVFNDMLTSFESSGEWRR